MRVAHLTTVDSAITYLLMPQLTSLMDAGAEVTAISARGMYSDSLEQLGIRHLALRSSTRGMNLLADFRSAIELWRILRTERFDILHTHNPKPGIYGRILGRLAGVPIIVNTVHGLYATDRDKLAKRIIIYFLEALASRFSDAELIQSSEDFDFMTRSTISPRRKTRLLGNGINTGRYDPERFTDSDRLAIRRELAITEEQCVVGMVGRLVAEKGYLELFEAARLLDPGYAFVTLGHADPDKPDALPQDAICLAQEQGVKFLGMRDDVERFYAVMDIFVLPSYREGVPRAAMEACAMGIPIVATDIRGCREVVEHGVNGLLIPPRSVDALASAIKQLADDPEKRSSMGRAGYARAREHFDERRVVSTVLKTYRELAARKGITADSTSSPKTNTDNFAKHHFIPAVLANHHPRNGHGPDSFNVLISSAGRRVALHRIWKETLESLGLRGKTLAADASPLSSAFHTADEGFVVPRCTDPTFIDEMLAICRRQNVRIIVPTIDPELPIYAANRQRFAEIGTTVMISSPDVVGIAWDKGSTHSWLVEHGFPTVALTEPSQLVHGPNGWRFPVLVKPRSGSASVGVQVVTDLSHMGLATRDGDYVVQSLAPGTEYTVDVLADGRGRCVCAVPRKRLEVRAGESSKGMTVRDHRLITLTRQICETLPGAFGPLNIQMFLEEATGTINVIEINPRFGGGFPLSWNAGAHYPRWMIEELLSLPSTAAPDRWASGRVMLRWDEGVFVTAEAAGLSPADPKSGSDPTAKARV